MQIHWPWRCLQILYIWWTRHKAHVIPNYGKIFTIPIQFIIKISMLIDCFEEIHIQRWYHFQVSALLIWQEHSNQTSHYIKRILLQKELNLKGALLPLRYCFCFVLFFSATFTASVSVSSNWIVIVIICRKDWKATATVMITKWKFTKNRKGKCWYASGSSY